jgi:hypothetical protein
VTNNHRAIVALADPTRRGIFELVAARPRSVAELTQGVAGHTIGRVSISQNLAGGSARKPEPVGARNIYYLDPVGLGQMRALLDQMWAAALDKFKRQIEKEKG